MSGPGYAWKCHVCERISVATAAKCEHCGFPAVATATQVALARGEPDPMKSGYITVGKGVGKGIAWLLAFFIPSTW